MHSSSLTFKRQKDLARPTPMKEVAEMIIFPQAPNLEVKDQIDSKLTALKQDTSFEVNPSKSAMFELE